MNISRDIKLYVFISFLMCYFLIMQQAFANIEQIDKNLKTESILNSIFRKKPELNRNAGSDTKKFRAALDWLNGVNNHADNKKYAVVRFHKEAAQGDTRAQVFLGYMYARGRGVPKDINQAMALFKKSANSGNDWAQTILGSLYKNGKHIPKDIDKAKYWYKRAAQQGNERAKRYLKNLNGNQIK